jgi:hypothetical protein
MKNVKFFCCLILLAFIVTSCNQKKEEVPKEEFKMNKVSAFPAFNADNAFGGVEKIVALSPRDPNSAGHEKVLQYLSVELKKYCDDLQFQSFDYPGYNTTLKLTNLIAKFNPSAKKRIFICVHWDSRPRADQDKDEKLKDKPILGANDGASGMGVMLELARVLKSSKVKYGVDLIFFDGEDYGKESDLNNYCLGSKYFAQAVQQDYKPVFGILLDMVGDKEAVFRKEGNSVAYAPEVTDMIWNMARTSGSSLFSDEKGSPIYDDHIPLNEAGIKTVDIIDIDLVGANTTNPRRKYWHTQGDDMSNISKEALRQTGETLVRMLYSLELTNN